jgi:hypothetical protein
MHVRGNSNILITGGAPRRALGNPSVKLWRRERKKEKRIRIGKLNFHPLWNVVRHKKPTVVSYVLGQDGNCEGRVGTQVADDRD